ncbi:MAG: NAD metabolism ATPase/kinase [Aequorivita sp.]|nr:NAD metabolism ATPase/kinase [Aequorivita sp.]|tara:strand:+ start:113229 stop:114752 length:1524 start_codon:yes stop_codon:yes gene_type:complete
MFTEKNINQITAHGLTKEKVKAQLQIFKDGIPYVNVVAPASADNGIAVFSEDEQQYFVTVFEEEKTKLDLLKFVPASGAATRMFKFLHNFLDSYKPEEDIGAFLEKAENKNLKIFFNSIEKFAFSALVFQKLEEKFPDFQSFKKGKQYFLFVKELLHESGLNFSNTPKGLVPFHKYENQLVTAFEEQLFEAAFYATSNGTAYLHFTVSENHEQKFKDKFAAVQQSIKNKTGVRFKIDYSFQKRTTDTVAVTPNNNLFVDENGNLIFRPSGHGALLENLNDVDADVIFIKNIDNVVSKNYIETIAFQKKVLAGKLISVQQQIFSFIKALRASNISEELLQRATNFISEELKIKNIALQKDAILNVLDRPLRVCGVVENTGAPGGGPFLIKDKDGNLSYQIVEMSQINASNFEQKALVEKATHFNPVDLVCGVRNYKGEKFDLLKYSDPETGFISEKSHHGKPIKALEMPGLWNGAMAHWNTIFVEVPLITFNPVKTVNDLLNDVHQPT